MNPCMVNVLATRIGLARLCYQFYSRLKFHQKYRVSARCILVRLWILAEEETLTGSIATASLGCLGHHLRALVRRSKSLMHWWPNSLLPKSSPYQHHSSMCTQYSLTLCMDACTKMCCEFTAKCSYIPIIA